MKSRRFPALGLAVAAERGQEDHRPNTAQINISIQKIRAILMVGPLHR